MSAICSFILLQVYGWIGSVNIMARGDQAQQYFDTAWGNSSCFATYETRRQYVTPILMEQVRDTFADHLQPGSKILEVGAGAGALSRYAGDGWPIIETEHNPDFLRLPRHHESAKASMTLPSLGIASDSVDAVVGLGVLDTLSSKTVEKLGPEFLRILRLGGKVIHFMDMSPDLLAEVYNAQQEGLIPFIKSNQQTGDVELLHVETKGYEERVKRLSVDQPVKNVLISYLNDPARSLAQMNRTNLLGFLADTVLEGEMVVQSHPDFSNFVTERIIDSGELCGLSLVANHLVSSEACYSLPPELERFNGLRIHSLRRHAGVVSFDLDDSGLMLSGIPIKAMSDMRVLIMEKPTDSVW